MVVLRNARYMMDMSVGGDYWKLFGNCYNHPNFPDGNSIFLSTPKAIDCSSEFPVVTTVSGRQYSIQSFGTNRDQVIEQIKKDIELGGYESH